MPFDPRLVEEADRPADNDSALVAAIIALADALGLEVAAEGVETQDQLATGVTRHHR